jgi:hypothetical protein
MAEGGIDTSIYAPLMKPTNPMEQTNNFLDTASKVNNNRLQQQAIQSNAIGIDQKQMELALQKVGAVNTSLSGLIGDPDFGKKDLSKKISDVAVRWVNAGVYSAPHMAEALKSMPSDPAQQAIWLRNIYSQTQGAEQRAQSFFGSPQGTPDQAGTQFSQTPGYPGLPTHDRGRINNQLAPGTPTRATNDPNSPDYGAPAIIGPASAPGIQQGPDVMPPANGAPARAMVPSSPKVMGDKEAQATGLYPPAPGSTAPIQPTPVQTTKPIITGLPPGTAQSMEGAASAYNDASAAAGKYAQRVNPLRQAIPLLEKMKETDIGPTSERWNDLKSTAITLGAGKIIGGIDPEKIRDFNELKKYFSQYSSQAAATLGPKTNDGLATAVTSNPNVHMDKLSALELSKVAMGVERMQQAGVREFNALVEAGKASPSGFNKFMVKWGTEQDPRAFVYDLLTPDQQAKLKRTLSPAELNKIRNGMNIADRHGLLGDVHQ